MEQQWRKSSSRGRWTIDPLQLVIGMMESKVTLFTVYIACEQAPLFGQAKRASRERTSGFAARSRVLARLASLAQIGELARRLRFTKIQLERTGKWNTWRLFKKFHWKISRSSGMSVKVFLFFPVVFLFFKATFDTSLRFSPPFLGKWNWFARK